MYIARRNSMATERKFVNNMECLWAQAKRLGPILLFVCSLYEVCTAINNTSTTHPLSTQSNCFSCDQTLQCISYHKVCDHYPDCHDKTDELNCTCGEGLFQCDNGVCISHVFTCNHLNDCGDFSDERNCAEGSTHAPNCPRGQYACANGKCIFAYKECDGVDNCGDASDELHCACPSYDQKCATYGCVTSEELCDGIYHCEDKSDEENCLPELRWDVWLEIGVAIFFVLIFSIVCAATRCCMGPPKSHSPRRRQQAEDPGLELATIGQANPSFDDLPPAYDACVVPDTIWTTSQSGLPNNPAVSCPDIVIVHNDNNDTDNTRNNVETRSTQSVNNVNNTENNTDNVSETVSVASTLPAYDDYNKYPTAPPDGESKRYITDGASPLQSIGSSLQSVS